jgi:hypothetical protein
MKKINFLILLFTVICFGNALSQAPLNPEITPEEIDYHIRYLASEELEGRMTGTEELYKAAVYLQNEFERYGLKPFFEGSYLQEFPFMSGIELGENLHLKIISEGSVANLKTRTDFIPLSFTDNIELAGNLVYAGYGISAEELDYDDYKDLDVKNKVVVVLRSHPDKKNPHSQFEKYSSLRFKTTTARDKGASGIIFINDYEKDSDDLIDLKYDNASSITGIAAVNIRRNFIETLFNEEGKELKSIVEETENNLAPNSFDLKTAAAEIKVEIKRIEKASWNVGAFIPANDINYSNEYLVIGAHFDHLGWGEQNSLYMGDIPMIHYGADDNASGTTGLLELAEKLISVKDQLKRNVVFTAFSGEELGLLGSSYLVNNFPIPINEVVTMINMDMIGRLNENNDLIVYGTGTSSNWKDILNKYNSDELNLTFNDEGFGPSDHASFYGKQIPVLFFFTGTHTDYHKPSDTYEKINKEGQQKVLKFVYDIAYEIINSEAKPDYLAVERKERGQMSGTRVWVGTVPDFAGEVDGYKLGGVTEGSPADKAGLKAGDIIKSFGGKKISNIYDFTYALGDFVPGDKVEITVLRGDEQLIFEIELSSR